ILHRRNKIIDPLNQARIGIATTYGRPYYKFVKALNTLKLQYDSLLPEEINTYEGSLILTTFKESPKFSQKPILHEEIIDKEPAVIRGLMIQKLEGGLDKNDLVLGIDPGQRTGLSVFYFGKEIERSIFTSIEDLVMHVAKILAELKAERRISLKVKNYNQRGKRDMMSAKYITQREGYRHFILPLSRTG